MVCRCSSHQEHAQRAAEQNQRTLAVSESSLRKRVSELEKELRSLEIDVTNYEVLRVEELKGNLVLWVRYPSCEHRSPDKVMVFLGRTAKEALSWKSIDPHFYPEDGLKRLSPSPSARFPGTETGWADALMYAGNKPSSK